jgi:trans-feruloyl-CoA hydratase/vanillin synthase
MTFETILVDEDASGVVTITLNRPDKRNAMNPQLHYEMDALLADLEQRSDVRALILTGAGDAFCAGMDLKEYFLENRDQPQAMDRLRAVSQQWRARRLRLFPAPTIAMVNGFCIGGGISLVAACDIAIADEAAVFNLSEVNFGQIPAGPVSRALADIVDLRDAMYYILTGEPFDGVEAAKMRLVTRAVPGAELRSTVAALAQTLAAKNPHALRLSKELYLHSRTMDWEAALNFANAKVHQLTAVSNGEWIDKGIPGFLRGEYRPGLGAVQAPPATDGVE